MPAPSCYFDSIRHAREDEHAAIESFRADHDAPLVPHRDAHDLAAFDFDGAPVAAIRLCINAEACLCGLAVAPTRMRSALPYRLARAWYELALARGASHAHTRAETPYQKLLLSLGFRASPSRPQTLRLALHDYEHLVAIGSPLAAVLSRWRAAPGQHPR